MKAAARALPLVIAACAALIALGGAEPKPSPAAAAKSRTPIFDSKHGLAAGWHDLGWAPHTLAPGAPASVDFSKRGGWIFSHPDLEGSFGSLTFRLRAPASFGTFLEVGVDSGLIRFPLIRIAPEDAKEEKDGFALFRIAMRDLNPAAKPFERLLFRAYRDVGQEPVLLDDIALEDLSSARFLSAHPARPANLMIDCKGAGHPISPLIYGVATDEPDWAETGATARRWGGNANTRYNWEQGHAWNAGNDWFFRNHNYSKSNGAAYDEFLDENVRRGVKSALTVPMIGWVAKDTKSYSFPVSVLGPQRATAPEDPDAGNGVALDGAPLAPLPPTRTSVPAPPAFISKWVQAIREKDEQRGRSVHEYILDNEPTLWDTNHRDVHPEPVSYAELLERTISYGTAVREADPGAVIAGPAAWGYQALQYSALDLKVAGGPKLDRLAHGNVALLPWWLQKVRAHEKKTGVRLLDVVDVHFYPMAPNMGLGSAGGVDPDTAALRIRSTRALWDPTYVDESWLREPIKLIPRLQGWIDGNAPGLGISIGEYNFGAEGHMSGGLAVAEALGRFGSERVWSAFYWTAPPKGTPAFWAFRAYRNFDGRGGRFLDLSVPAQSETQTASIFASRDKSGARLVAVLLNFDPDSPAAAQVKLSHCGRVKTGRALTYAGSGSMAPLAEGPRMPPGAVSLKLPPYSITVLDLTVEPD